MNFVFNQGIIKSNSADQIGNSRGKACNMQNFLIRMYFIKLFYQSKNTKFILDKSYLNRNHSHFDLIHFPNTDPFLTTYRRDVNPGNINNKAGAKNISKNFIKASQIVLGDHIHTTNSSYRENYEGPNFQKSMFDYDKVKFKYDEYKTNPITSELIFKPEQNNWAFDYYNRDKNKFYSSNDKSIGINPNFRRVYDNITNRYLN